MRCGTRGTSAVVLVGLLAAVNVLAAGDGCSVDASASFASAYVVHGFDIGDNEPALQPSVTVGCPVTGLRFQGWASLPFDRDADASDELDAILRYGRSVGGTAPWAMDLYGYLDFWYYPNLDLVSNRRGESIEATEKQGAKWHVGVALPKLIAAGGISVVPAYNVYHWWPTTKDLFDAGTAHELVLSASSAMAPWIPGCDKQSISASAATTYHDGAFGVKSGWSHAVAGLSTAHHFDRFCASPSVNYQWSFEDTVDDEDEFWCALTVSVGL